MAMTIFKLLLACISTFSTLTFVVLFGHIPSLRRTPIGWSHQLLMVQIPRMLSQIDQAITGGRICQFLAVKQGQMMNDRHPTVLIMYLVLFTGGVFIFVTRVLARLAFGHWLIVPIFITLPLYTLYMAATTDPGYITAQNHMDYIAKYHYDGVLFRRGHECSTCRREKPKHCSLCKQCIAKHDHHCIWINSCVGERNMKWFLAFLTTNILTFTYASITLFLLLRDVKKQHSASSIVSDAAQERGIQLWLTVLRKDVFIGSLFLFVTLCDVLVIAFLVYHSYLIFSGVTTNETLKFEDIRVAIDDGEVAVYASPDSTGFYLDRPGKGQAIPLKDVDNVYDKGWRQNFVNVFNER